MAPALFKQRRPSGENLRRFFSLARALAVLTSDTLDLRVKLTKRHAHCHPILSLTRQRSFVLQRPDKITRSTILEVIEFVGPSRWGTDQSNPPRGILQRGFLPGTLVPYGNGASGPKFREK
jgi:hypothetical protein